MRFHPHTPPAFAEAIQYPCCVPAAVLGSSTRVPPATGTTLDPLARRNVAGDLLRTVAGSRTLSRNTEPSRAWMPESNVPSPKLTSWPNILASYTPANRRLGCGAGSARYARETHHVYRGRPDLPGVCASHANPRIISWWPDVAKSFSSREEFPPFPRPSDSQAQGVYLEKLTLIAQ